eukprot:TRINITY_DN9479_c0_g1_i1.p1 TRINITY_DN9479_c0_g1~~TRINITY_DN9479_c0_g1_i1.p1  ORF type:complete len:224 (-),score=26.89 TRINITY_DN9479_c0_g1_i1:32-625(-)
MHADAQMPKFFNPFLLGANSMLGIGCVTRDVPPLRMIPLAPWWPQFCKDMQLDQDTMNKINVMCEASMHTQDVMFIERQACFQRIFEIYNTTRISPHYINYDMPGDNDADLHTRTMNRATTLHQQSEILRINCSGALKMITSFHMQICAMLPVRQQAELVVRAYGGLCFSGGDLLGKVMPLWKAISASSTTSDSITF